MSLKSNELCSPLHLLFQAEKILYKNGRLWYKLHELRIAIYFVLSPYTNEFFFFTKNEQRLK